MIKIKRSLDVLNLFVNPISLVTIRSKEVDFNKKKSNPKSRGIVWKTENFYLEDYTDKKAEEEFIETGSYLLSYHDMVERMIEDIKNKYKDYEINGMEIINLYVEDNMKIEIFLVCEKYEKV